MLHFHGKFYRYSKRNVLALADNEVKTERVEPCIDAQFSCFGVHELKRHPIDSSLKLDHYRIFDTFNIRQPLEVPSSHWNFGSVYARTGPFPTF